MERLYRFLGEDDELLYIGRTNSLDKRMKQHFEKKPLPSLAYGGYDEVVKIQATNSMEEIEAVILEAAMIRKNYPKYNQEFKHGDCMLPHIAKCIKESKIDVVEWGFHAWNPTKPVDDQMKLFEVETRKDDESRGLYID